FETSTAPGPRGSCPAGPAPASVFVATACGFLWSGAMIARIAADVEPPATRERHGFLHESTAGFRAIRREPSLRLVVLLYSAQTVVAGALNVLLVVAALDLLDLGQSRLG